MVAPINGPTGTKQEIDPRRRLRELLAVPERERTDAQWDEIASLEIQLAPGNRLEPARRPDAFPTPGPVRQPARREAPSPRGVGHKHRKPRG